MTKAEAVVMRAALRCCRAKKKYDESQDVRDQHWLHGTLEELIGAVESAAKEFKEWIVLRQGVDVTEHFIQCQGCRVEQKVSFPLPMNQLSEIIDGFRAKHLDCGPVGE